MRPITVNGAPGLALLNCDPLAIGASLTLDRGCVRRIDLTLGP
ncbi:MAG: hypothetical protein ACYDB7_06760 [Mycobacteriales bacterium]